MTNDQLVIIIAAIPTILAGIGSIIVSLRNSTKLTEIHTLTNSNLSKVKTQLDIAMQKIEGMNDLIQQMKVDRMVAEKDKDALAAAVATTALVASAAPAIQDVKIVNTPADPAIVKPIVTSPLKTTNES